MPCSILRFLSRTISVILYIHMSYIAIGCYDHFLFSYRIGYCMFTSNCRSFEAKNKFPFDNLHIFKICLALLRVLYTLHHVNIVAV